MTQTGACVDGILRCVRRHEMKGYLARQKLVQLYRQQPDPQIQSALYHLFCQTTNTEAVEHLYRVVSRDKHTTQKLPIDNQYLFHLIKCGLYETSKTFFDRMAYTNNGTIDTMCLMHARLNNMDQMATALKHRFDMHGMLTTRINQVDRTDLIDLVKREMNTSIELMAAGHSDGRYIRSVENTDFIDMILSLIHI